MVSVVCRIRHDMSDARKPFDQAAGLRTIAPLAGGDDKADWEAKRIYRSVNFRGQPALGASDGVSLSPPF